MISAKALVVKLTKGKKKMTEYFFFLFGTRGMVHGFVHGWGPACPPQLWPIGLGQPVGRDAGGWPAGPTPWVNSWLNSLSRLICILAFSYTGLQRDDYVA